MKSFFTILAMMLSFQANAYQATAPTAQKPSVICNDGHSLVAKAYNPSRYLPQAVLVVEKVQNDASEVIYNGAVKTVSDETVSNFTGEGIDLKVVEFENGEISGFLTEWEKDYSATRALKCQILFQIMNNENESNVERYNPDI